MRNLLLLVFLLILIRANVEAIVIYSRTGQKCALLSNKIYCYGGTVIGEDKYDDNYYRWNSLDIYINEGASTHALNSLWEDVMPSSSDFEIGNKDFSQVAAAPDGIHLLFQGGNATYSRKNQTIAYNSETNTWKTFANYSDIRNGGDRQIYYGSGEYIPSLDGFGFFGGKQTLATLGTNYTTPDGIIISDLTHNTRDENNITESLFGFYYLTLFNMKTNTWTVPLPQTNVPPLYRIAFSATYHPKTKKMFYIGGGDFYDEHPEFYQFINMSLATTYNTVNGNWSEEFISGKPPSERQKHTTTLLPNGDYILLYGGGMRDESPVRDFCFTLHVPTMTWKSHNSISPPFGASGPRSQHSAILVKNASLFILFGRDIEAKPVSELLILDVRDASNITFADKFSLDDTAGKKNGGNFSGGDEINPPKKVLSTGAIAGIAVGGIIAAALAILGLVCCLRKKTKQTQENNQDGVLEVDWDKIDNNYKEVNFPPYVVSSTSYQQQKPDVQQQQGQKNSTQQHILDNLYSEADSNNTVTSKSQPLLASATNNDKSKPNIVEPILPDIVKPSIPTSLTKPDGSV